MVIQLSSKPKFKVDDKVRISKYKRKIFDNIYASNWTEVIFTIENIQNTNESKISIIKG